MARQAAEGLPLVLPARGPILPGDPNRLATAALAERGFEIFPFEDVPLAVWERNGIEDAIDAGRIRLALRNDCSPLACQFCCIATAFADAATHADGNLN